MRYVQSNPGSALISSISFFKFFLANLERGEDIRRKNRREIRVVVVLLAFFCCCFLNLNEYFSIFVGTCGGGMVEEVEIEKGFLLNFLKSFFFWKIIKGQLSIFLRGASLSLI